MNTYPDEYPTFPVSRTTGSIGANVAAVPDSPQSFILLNEMRIQDQSLRSLIGDIEMIVARVLGHELNETDTSEKRLDRRTGLTGEMQDILEQREMMYCKLKGLTQTLAQNV